MDVRVATRACAMGDGHPCGWLHSIPLEPDGLDGSACDYLPLVIAQSTIGDRE
jgi:hypothetical protein